MRKLTAAAVALAAATLLAMPAAASADSAQPAHSAASDVDEFGFTCPTTYEDLIANQVSNGTSRLRLVEFPYGTLRGVIAKFYPEEQSWCFKEVAGGQEPGLEGYEFEDSPDSDQCIAWNDTGYDPAIDEWGFNDEIQCTFATGPPEKDSELWDIADSDPWPAPSSNPVWIHNEYVEANSDIYGGYGGYDYSCLAADPSNYMGDNLSYVATCSSSEPYVTDINWSYN